MFFHVHYLQVYAITLFLLQFGVMRTCKFYKDHELKMYSCLLTPNCTRNRAIAYIYNMYIYIYIYRHFQGGIEGFTVFQFFVILFIKYFIYNF